jgi:flavin-dependent dehydrogenase
MPRALVFGWGLAGLSCAKILARQGWDVEVRGAVSKATPILVLNDVTCDVLHDLWQAENELLPGAHVINERKVCWGADGSASVVVQSGVVIKGDVLITHLLESLNEEHDGQIRIDDSPGCVSALADPRSFRRVAQEFDWIIDAGGRASHINQILGATRHSFGRRHAISAEVTLEESSERHACWIELVRNGWVFMAPLGKERALVQAMTPAPPEDPSAMLTALLGQTRFIKAQVANASSHVSVFQASPQISEPLCGPGWIAVGDAAISLDPICGDGAGYALRGAILAASVIDGAASGLLMSDCLRHYALRLHKAFFSHLKECLGYYSMLLSSLRWQDEIGLMEPALPKGFLKPERFSYALNGFALEPLGAEFSKFHADKQVEPVELAKRQAEDE